MGGGYPWVTRAGGMQGRVLTEGQPWGPGTPETPPPKPQTQRHGHIHPWGKRGQVRGGWGYQGYRGNWGGTHLQAAAATKLWRRLRPSQSTVSAEGKPPGGS